MRANLHLNGERPKGERAKRKRRDGSTMPSLMMVKAVQKFHDKINALSSASDRSLEQIGRDWPEQGGQGQNRSCYQECILINTSDNDFAERFSGKEDGSFDGQRSSLHIYTWVITHVLRGKVVTTV